MKYRKKPIVIEAMQFKGLPFSTEFPYSSPQATTSTTRARCTTTSPN